MCEHEPGEEEGECLGAKECMAWDGCCTIHINHYIRMYNITTAGDKTIEGGQAE